MGCGLSNEYDTIYKTSPKVKVYRRSFMRLGLDERDVGKLYTLFSKCKVDKSLHVHTKDMLFHLHEKATTFMERIITAFSQDKRQLNFQEFVYGLWSFCTLKSKQKSYDQFVFNLYDEQDSGALPTLKAQQILEDIYMSSLKRNPVAFSAHKAMERTDAEQVTLEQFHKLSDMHGGMLTEVYHMQENMRRRVLGIKAWEKLEQVRVDISGGKTYARMDRILVCGYDPPEPDDDTEPIQSHIHAAPALKNKKMSLKSWDLTGDAKIGPEVTGPSPCLGEGGKKGSRRGSVGRGHGLGDPADYTHADTSKPVPGLGEMGKRGSRRGSGGGVEAGPGLGEVGKRGSRRGSGGGGGLPRASSSRRGSMS